MCIGYDINCLELIIQMIEHRIDDNELVSYSLTGEAMEKQLKRTINKFSELNLPHIKNSSKPSAWQILKRGFGL